MGLYEVLLRLDPSPVVELNRAVAVAMRDGPEAGLALIDAILARGELAEYHLTHAARVDLWPSLEPRPPAGCRNSLRPDDYPVKTTPEPEHIMKYLCLIYIDEQTLEQTPADVVEAVAKECLAHTEALQKSGQLIACERLESVQTATTVRARQGNVSVTDGPFAETKEQLAGFYLIEARDLNEAIRIASHIPPGRFGCIEVRPVMAGDLIP